MEPESGAGPTRRQLIRRTAVLAGAVAWTAPAVQSLAPAAFADGSPGCIGCLTGGGQILELGGAPDVFCANGVVADKISFGLGPICCPTHDPTEVEVVCHPGDGSAEQYHFDLYDVVTCSKTGDPSPPPGSSSCANRFQGTVQDNAGNVLTFDLTDNGEPGRNDIVSFVVTAPGGAVLVSGAGSLARGNLQAHEHLGKPLNLACDCD